MSAVADIGLPSANNAAVGYFVDQKKGEVNELKQVSFFATGRIARLSLHF